MPHRKKFYVYKRMKKSGEVYYACFIDPTTGKQGNAKSIDVLALKLGLWEGASVRSYEDAVIIANKALEEGIIFLSSSVTFESYCLSHWNYGSSQYVRLKNSLKKGSVGKEYCINMTSNFKNNVIPALPKGILLRDVTTKHLDDVISRAFSKGLSSGTVQMVEMSFSSPLKEAYRQGLITRNPADFLYAIPRSEKARGTLSEEEARSLMVALDDFETTQSVRLAVKLSISTGMRSGEVRALNVSDIDRFYLLRKDGIELDRIRVSKSYAPYTGLKGTKSGYERSVMIPSSFGSELVENADSSGLVIQSVRGGYMSSSYLRHEFYKLLASLGIEHKERNITYHSLRHFFATFTYDEGADLEGRMNVLGHRSLRVNSRYTHVTCRQLESLSYCSSKLLSAEKSAEESIGPEV